MSSVTPRFDELNFRRRELGISYSALAALSGVSKPAIQRILTGKCDAPGLTIVVALARALGMIGIRFLSDGSIQFDSRADARTLREQQAWNKACELVRMKQDRRPSISRTWNESDYHMMLERTYDNLLTGSARRLWDACDKAIDKGRRGGRVAGASARKPAANPAVPRFADSN